MALRGSVTEKVPIEAGQLFAVITDLDGLPEWNTIIRRVVERPSALARDRGVGGRAVDHGPNLAEPVDAR